MKKKLSVMIILFIMAVGVAIVIQIYTNSPAIVPASNKQPYIPPTPSFPSAAENSFKEMLGQDVNLNLGITIHRPSFGIVLEGPTPDVNNVTFYVFNHTDEPIRFEDISFGNRIFWFDPQNQMWKQIQLQYSPELSPQTLPARLETYSSSAMNMWFIPSRIINKISQKELRLYVEGVGTLTKKKYGAFLNLTVVP